MSLADVSRMLLDAQHAMIARVRDVNVASAGMSNDAMGFAEQGLQRWPGDAFAALGSVTDEGDELALSDDKLADAMIAGVGDENIVIAIYPKVLDASEWWDGVGVVESLHFAVGVPPAHTETCGDEDVALGVHGMGATAADAREGADKAGAHVHHTDTAFAIATDAELGAVMIEGEAGDPTKSGSHSRAAIARNFLVPIASEGGDDASLGIHPAHTVMKGVGDVEVACRISDEVMRRVEAGVTGGAVVANRRSGFRL